MAKKLTMKFNIMYFIAYIIKGIKFQSYSKSLTLNGKYYYVNINININITKYANAYTWKKILNSTINNLHKQKATNLTNIHMT